MMKPYLVNSVLSNGVPVKQFKPTVLDEKICKPEVIKAAKECMEAVVTEGTAKAAFADASFPVAGKTGTAHVAGGDVKYYNGVYQATFVGYFPADAPEYTCIVLIKTKPFAPLHFGGQLAAPVFKEIATKLYALYVEKKKDAPVQLSADSTLHTFAGYTQDVEDVFKTLNVKYEDSAGKNNWSTVNTLNNEVVTKPIPVNAKLMPDVRNLTLRDALYVLENMNIKVAVKGKGKVLMQDVQPGTPLKKNQTITLLLN